MSGDVTVEVVPTSSRPDEGPSNGRTAFLFTAGGDFDLTIVRVHFPRSHHGLPAAPVGSAAAGERRDEAKTTPRRTIRHLVFTAIAEIVILTVVGFALTAFAQGR
ncbi:MAG: hypothetical protein DIJKHBIC_02335 [Thermoanaerobaculia bacterium]|nr:hypothetical protein [Thermoanaerobaculia bacterium]